MSPSTIQALGRKVSVCTSNPHRSSSTDTGAAAPGDEGSWGSTGNVPSAITHPEALLAHIPPEVPTTPCGPTALHDPQNPHEALQPLGACTRHRGPHRAFPNPHSPISPPPLPDPLRSPRRSTATTETPPPFHRPHPAPLPAPPDLQTPPQAAAAAPSATLVQPHSPKDPAPRKPPAPPVASPALKALRSPAAPYRGSAPPGC